MNIFTQGKIAAAVVAVAVGAFLFQNEPGELVATETNVSQSLGVQETKADKETWITPEEQAALDLAIETLIFFTPSQDERMQSILRTQQFEGGDL